MQPSLLSLSCSDANSLILRVCVSSLLIGKNEPNYFLLCSVYFKISYYERFPFHDDRLHTPRASSLVSQFKLQKMSAVRSRKRKREEIYSISEISEIIPSPSPVHKKRRKALRIRPLDEIIDNPELNIAVHLDLTFSPKNKNKIGILTKLIDTHWLFEDISDSLKTKLFKEFHLVSYKAEDIIFTKGEELSNFMVIESGDCEDSAEKEVHSAKSTFGDINLIHKETTAEYTLKCLTDVELWTIEGGVYQFVCKKHGEEQDSEEDLTNNALRGITDSKVEESQDECISSMSGEDSWPAIELHTVC